jgi:hypothetical protein
VTLRTQCRLVEIHRGVDLISDALPFGRLWYKPDDAIGYAKHRNSRCITP